MEIKMIGLTIFAISLLPGVACVANIASDEKPNQELFNLLATVSLIALFFVPLLVLAYWAAAWVIGPFWGLILKSVRAHNQAHKYP